jgi:hypothetical protein
MSYLCVKWNSSGCGSLADVSDISAWFVLRCHSRSEDLKRRRRRA